jgi:hypothetical protein
MEKLWIDRKEFITSEELEQYCKLAKMDCTTVIQNLLSRKYLLRIFRGIFYVNTLEQLKLGKSNYNHLQLVANGLKLKGIKNWYFGLHTALTLNNMTNEHFVVEEVLSDSIFRPNPFDIAGYKFRFVKLTPHLVKFGIINGNMQIRYSDPEKTILDLIYLSRQKGSPIEKIINDVSSWSKELSENKIRRYVKEYPKTVATIAEMVVK